MKLSDTASGLLAAILGVAVIALTRTFPPMHGQPIGPSLFPTLIGTVLIAAGALLIVADARRRGGAFLQLDDWMRRPRMRLNFALVLAVLIFYALAVDRLGFILTAVTFLTVLFFAFGVRRGRVLPVAVAVTLVIHYGFYTLLRVPLPWGVLEVIAW